jgi:hypothetical protein
VRRGYVVLGNRCCNAAGLKAGQPGPRLALCFTAYPFGGSSSWLRWRSFCSAASGLAGLTHLTGDLLPETCQRPADVIGHT